MRPVSMVLAGVEIDDELDTLLHKAGAPIEPGDLRTWLRAHGLQMVNGDDRPILGLILAHGRFRDVGPVDAEKTRRLFALAKERLHAVGIDREPTLILRADQAP